MINRLLAILDEAGISGVKKIIRLMAFAAEELSRREAASALGARWAAVAAWLRLDAEHYDAATPITTHPLTVAAIVDVSAARMLLSNDVTQREAVAAAVLALDAVRSGYLANNRAELVRAGALITAAIECTGQSFNLPNDLQPAQSCDSPPLADPEPDLITAQPPSSTAGGTHAQAVPPAPLTQSDPLPDWPA